MRKLGRFTPFAAAIEAEGEPKLALADFIAPTGTPDYIGRFRWSRPA